MATFLPRTQIPSRPHQDLPPSSPPNQATFHMNNVPQDAPSGASRPQHRASADYRVNGSPAFGNGDGAMPTPSGARPRVANGGSRHRATGSGPAFDGPRSPPNTKNTSHVPCKFFRSGQCQAGQACPFSHSTDISTVDTPCKYFSKGNCKFGAKCALAHVLPNGRRVNRPNGGLGGHLNLGGRVDPQIYHSQDSALANSLLAQQANGNAQAFNHQFSQMVDSDYSSQHGPLRPYEVPTIEKGYASNPGSTYGSPRDDTRLPTSPVAHLSALDAPMPASFDSQGISYMARHGPVAASVPSKFGLESPPSSLPKKAIIPADSVRNVSESAYSKDARSRAANMGSSPVTSGDEGLGQRIMHSQRRTKPKMMSASLPRGRGNDDWDEQFIFGGEEDFLPTSLHDLLTPQEKMRRLSRTEHETGHHREHLSGIGTPTDPSSKIGSPSGASPSRYGALFARQRQEEANNASHSSLFGHVGSPLRNSPRHPGASPAFRAASNPTAPGDVSPHFASPPARQSSMSALSQQLSHTRLASRTDPAESTSGLHPSSARHASHSMNGRPEPRNFSGSSFGTARIDEEGVEGVFSMEEDENVNKRYSGGWHSVSSGGRASPRTGPIGSGR